MSDPHPIQLKMQAIIDSFLERAAKDLGVPVEAARFEYECIEQSAEYQKLKRRMLYGEGLDEIQWPPEQSKS